MKLLWGITTKGLVSVRKENWTLEGSEDRESNVAVLSAMLLKQKVLAMYWTESQMNH